MNDVCVSGQILNVPRYDVIPATLDAIFRFLLAVGDTVLPVLCCNEMACHAQQQLLEAPAGKEIYVAGTMKGSCYTDAVGSKNYLLYLVADRIAHSEEDILKMPEKETTLTYEGLPFGVSDLEDILRYMER